MRRALLLVFACSVTVIGWIAYQFVSISPKSAPLTAKDSPKTTMRAVKPPETLEIDGQTYAYDYNIAPSASTVSLIPNFVERKDAKSLADANKCRSYISGGFYDTAGKPLGYFYTDNTQYAPAIPSALVNGYIWADTSTLSISPSLPDESYRFAMQTGPRLISGGQRLPLRIQNDELARRMVAAKTGDGRTVFLAVYMADSVYGGPLLGDLPSVVESISDKEDLGISEAINLDGGSASAFSNGDTRLSELTTVGSLFCVR